MLRLFSKIKAVSLQVLTLITLQTWWKNICQNCLKISSSADRICRGSLKLAITIQNVCTTWWPQASTRGWKWTHFLAICIELSGESWGNFQPPWMCFPSLTRPLGAWIMFCIKARCRWGFPSLTLATSPLRAQSQLINTLLTYPHLDQGSNYCWRKN